MKRVNGFLDLDEYFKNNVMDEKNNVTDGDFDYQNWMVINGQKYFFKITTDSYTELLAYEIATFLGIKATNYDLAIYEGNKGVISESFHKETNRYISGEEILKGYFRVPGNKGILQKMGFKTDKTLYMLCDPHRINNLEIIWQAIEQRYKLLNINIDIEKIMYDLVLLFIFNIIACQNDGLPHNWELEESENGVNLTQIFDNEWCFKINKEAIYPSSNLSTNFNDAYGSNYEILEEFLKSSSSEFINLFLEKFNMLSEDAFLKLIKKVEDKIGCEIPKNFKNSYILIFSLNKERIENVLENLGLNNKRK